MVRTVISLDADDKKWLDRKARHEHVPMAEVVRRAIKLYRAEAVKDSPPLADLLRETQGIWKKGDGLAYQQALRTEWPENR